MQLPAMTDMRTVLENLRAARTEVGRGFTSGGTFLKMNDKTGELTFGNERTPVPQDSRWIVPLMSFQYGYVDMQEGKLKERNVIPMLHGALPRPKGGSFTKDKDGQMRQLKNGEYGTFEGGGPQRVDEIVLTSLKEKGLNLSFTGWTRGDKPSANAERIGTLLERTIVHAESPEGKAGFVHPVVKLKPSSFYSTTFRRDVHFLDYEIVDWLHTDASTLLSKNAGKLTQQAEPENEDDESDDLPWDEDADSEMTDEDRELLRAG